jgi:hypothetical protein
VWLPRKETVMAPANRLPALPTFEALKQRIAHALFADVIQAAVNAAVSVRIDDSSGWEPLTQPGPHDRDFSEWLQDQEDALEAWRKNFMVRRVVTLTRSYVLGGGITLGSKHPWVNAFIQDFVAHPQNQLHRRLGPMCDELTRAGELFPVLFTNRVDGMSYVRFVPASQIRRIDTDPEDYETELSYLQAPGNDTPLEGKTWLGTANPKAWETASDGTLPPVMLHFAVNKPIGATRGEGDLGPILRWALRYSHWLEDRVRLNRVRTRGPGEEVTAHKLEIGADDAKEDGRALRLAIAAGANVALHYMGEGEAVNYATAREMGEPTARFYTERQNALCSLLLDMCKVAYQRKVATGLAKPPAKEDYKLIASVTETARADNQVLAEAALNIVTALGQMKAYGWVDDQTAVRLAFKFAGEAISQDEIESIIREAEPIPMPDVPAGDNGRTAPVRDTSARILDAMHDYIHDQRELNLQQVLDELDQEWS